MRTRTWIKISKNFDLGSRATFRIGGPAKYFFVADSLDELCESLQWAKDNGLPWFLLGRGSNILVSDDGFSGLVVSLGKNFQEINFSKDGRLLTAGGGCALSKVGGILANKGWAGFEFMCVIPGTVGAAVRINAGTGREGEIKDGFHSAEILTPDLEIKTFSENGLNFSYRYSDLIKKGGIVLKASFRLENKKPSDTINKKLTKIAQKRKQNQPGNVKNCGSVFRNPDGEKAAGWYIEQAGLKGMRIGGAQVAPEHANWIVNLGDSTADDVKKIIHHIQKMVLAKFGFALEREVIYIPEDLIKGDCWW